MKAIVITKILHYCNKNNAVSVFIFILLFSAINLRIVSKLTNEQFVNVDGISFHDDDEYQELLEDHGKTLDHVTTNNTSITRSERTSLIPSLLGENAITGAVTTIQQHDGICNGQSTSSDRRVKIIAFTDFSFRNLALEWYGRLTNLGYDTHTIITIDQESRDYFMKINQNKSEKERYRVEQQLVDKGTRRKEMIGSLWYNRLVYCLRQLKNGVSILLTDTDNIFRRYVPTCTFQDSNYDAIFAFELGYPRHIFRQLGFVICGGMTFLKSTNSTIQVLEKVIEACNYHNTSRCNDQAEWNRFSARQIRWSSDESKAKSNGTGLLQYGFEGESTTVEGFKCKIWDRDFAWRGTFFHNCPSQNNWVAMPLETPFWLEKRYSSLFTSDLVMKKIVRNKVYELFCDTNDGQQEGILNETAVNEKLIKTVEILMNKTFQRNKI